MLKTRRSYEDGSIRIWDAKISTVVIAFNGHKSAITHLAFDKEGVKLASGSKDTDIIIWDLIAETGLFKLRGHKDQITGLGFLYSPQLDATGNGAEGPDPGRINGDVSFSTSAELLISTSKDALIKAWSLDTRHCFETHVAQSNGECWALDISGDQSGLITAGNDGELRVWSLNFSSLEASLQSEAKENQRSFISERGTLHRQGRDRTLGVSFHPRNAYISAHGSDKAVEIWRIRSENEVQKALARKRKRRREKSQANGVEPKGILEKGDDTEISIKSADIADVIVPHVIVRTGGKVAASDWANPSSKTLQCLVAASNNLLEIWRLDSKPQASGPNLDEPPDYTRPFAIEIPGHRTDIRALSISSDDRMLASASNGTLKVWNIRTSSCIRTLESGYSLCASFLPGDKILVIGNRNGDLELFDITSSSLIEVQKAHDGPVWALHVHPDGKSVATGSADKTVKFFNFEIVQEEIPGTKRTSPRFKLVHTRTLKVNDDVLSLKFSPDSRLIALALLDNTVKVFFVDSLKLYLNLYGHKLPVLDMDISFDSKMIVTCSADKNVRLWGLDFGDCHKAIFGHQDSIMKVAFVPHNQDGNGHNFFSASKDHLVKYWDGDKFEQIQKLEGHLGELWAMAISRTGEFLVTASHDKSIRVWEQTDEQIFLEEEREKEMEELYEKTLSNSLEDQEEPNENPSEAVAASKQTVETLMAGEKIMEALDVGMEDLDTMTEYKQAQSAQSRVAPPARNPIYLANNNVSAEQYLLIVVQRVKAAALQDALLVLPFDKIPPLFTFLRIWAERQWNMPLTCRILFFMLKTHYRQIIANRTMRVLLDEVRVQLRKALQSQKDEVGFNLAALKFLGKKMEELGSDQYVDEERWEAEHEGKSTKKRAFMDVA